MKLFYILMLTLFATSTAWAAPSAGAFDKLQKMWNSGSAPTNLNSLIAEIRKLKGCAGSYQSAPNEISSFPLLIAPSYTKPAFGPEFPPEVITGIALNSTKEKIDVIGSDFFLKYRQNLTSQSLELTTSEFYTAQSCYKDADGFMDCSDYTNNRLKEFKIRQNAKNILIENKESYAYCWKE